MSFKEFYRWRPRSLGQEIALILVVKVAVLAGLWLAFFSDPVAEGLTAQGVAETLMGEVGSTSVGE